MLQVVVPSFVVLVVSLFGVKIKALPTSLIQVAYEFKIQIHISLLNRS